jgi:outer membrane murein-binding lipoprotein Lpp
MTEQEKKLVELADKAQDLNSTIRALHFRMRRTRKSLKMCKETCKQTNDLIEELHAGDAKHQ